MIDRRTSCWLGLCAAVMAGTPRAAHADRFGEIFVGAAIPVADDDYNDAFDTAVTFGGRVGGGSGPLALELGADYTIGNPEGDTTIGGVEVTTSRFRALVGGRLRTRLGAAVTGFVRGGAGVDLASVKAKGSFLGVTIDESDTDTGLALEVGAGVLAQAGSAAFGAQLAVPVGLHTTDQAAATDPDFDYTAVDVELLFTISSKF